MEHSHLPTEGFSKSKEPAKYLNKWLEASHHINDNTKSESRIMTVQDVLNGCYKQYVHCQQR